MESALKKVAYKKPAKRVRSSSSEEDSPGSRHANKRIPQNNLGNAINIAGPEEEQRKIAKLQEDERKKMLQEQEKQRQQQVKEQQKKEKLLLKQVVASDHNQNGKPTKPKKTRDLNREI